MKAYFIFAVGAAGLLTAAVNGRGELQNPPLIYETGQEFFGSGDFDGDGRRDVVIVDKETGKYRLGYLAESGLFNWVDNRPSGIKGISGFSLGPLFVTHRDGLVLTTADANQIVLAEASSPTSPERPRVINFNAALGPSVVVPQEIGGEGNTPAADLYVASIYNSPDENLATLLRNDGQELPKLAETVLPGVPACGQRVALAPSQGEYVGLVTRQGSEDSFHLQDVRAGKFTSLATLKGLPAGSAYTIGHFRGSSAPEFLFYKPGDPTLIVRAVEAVEAGQVRFAEPAKFDLDGPIRRVVTLDPATRHLFVIFGNGEKAGVYAFDGKQAPKLVQTVVATNDLITCAMAVPKGLIVFSEPATSKYSTRYQMYQAADGAYVPGVFGSLPTLADNDNITIPDIHARIVSKNQVAKPEEMKIYTNTIPGTRVSYVMVPIPGGQFTMGSPESEPGRKPDEGPQHKVEISPFWMGQCEITWNEYELFMYPDEEKRTRATVPTDEDGDKLADAVTHPSRPYVEMSFGMGKDGFPAISMTQHAANKYCQWLSAKTGHFYRLPTEAEWEYACRAGTTTAYYFGDDPAALKDHAWYEQNSDFKYQKVGRKKPNPWGLYDMCGNVVEWVLDQYDPEYYQRSSALGLVKDPWNKATKPYPHAVRGGSWDDEATMLRSAARRGSDRSWKMQDPQLPKSIWYFSDAQFVGFRIVRPLRIPPPEEMQKYWSSGVERD
jgi:formylglycine-generating enzyme required for sulfatase activity